MQCNIVKFGWCFSFIKWYKGGFGHRGFFELINVRKGYSWKLRLCEFIPLELPVLGYLLKSVNPQGYVCPSLKTIALDYLSCVSQTNLMSDSSIVRKVREPLTYRYSVLLVERLAFDIICVVSK